MKISQGLRLALASLSLAAMAAIRGEDGPTAEGTIVFSQDFSSNMDGFERSPADLPVDRIQLAPDPIGQRGQVLRIIWMAGDNYRTSSGTMPRSWASSAPGYQFSLGTTVNYAFGYMTSSTNIDANLAQNIRPGGPLWEMQGDRSGKLAIVVNGKTSWTQLGVTVAANRWYDIRVETKYVTGTGGHVIVWVDGVQRFSKTGIGWNDPAGTLARFDCGIYNRSSPQTSDLTKTRTVYISNLSVGVLSGGSSIVSAPAFNPAGGTYTGPQNVAITSATSGASLRYTTDGSTPSETAGTVYSGPVSIGSTTTLKAIAYKAGMADSSVTSATYTIEAAPPPTFNFEAESLSPTGSGATVSTSNDANASGGVVEFLNSTSAGQTMTFTTPSIPAGTYQIQLRYWGNVTRGQHTVQIDGTQLGGTIDQYATAKTYVSVILGTATFTSAGPHSIAMTVTGKRPAATKFYLTADKFTFVGK